MPKTNERTVARELGAMRLSLQMLEAAYFQLLDLLESRHVPYMLTIGEAAKVFGVGKTTMAHLIYDKRIRAKTVGKRKMVLRSSLETFAESGLAFQIRSGPKRELMRRPQCIHDLQSTETRARDVRHERTLKMVMAGAGPGWGPG